MLVGENALVGRDLLTDFQRTGTYHVLVISGLKVSILALVTFWLLRRLRVGDVCIRGHHSFVDRRLCGLDRRGRAGLASHTDAGSLSVYEVDVPERNRYSMPSESLP